MFTVNQNLIIQARETLQLFPNLYWVLGGSATGKSTICQTLAHLTGAVVYDMDAAIYGRYQPHYKPERHPACTAWFGAENSLAWIMALSPTEFDALNRATNAEYLDLLADDLQDSDASQPLLIDGGFTHPSIVNQVAEPSRIICLAASREMVIDEWNSNEERLAMKGWIHDLPNPEAMWQKFLDFDQLMSDTMVRESNALGIRIFRRDEATAVADLAQEICQYFELS